MSRLCYNHCDVSAPLAPGSIARLILPPRGGYRSASLFQFCHPYNAGLRRCPPGESERTLPRDVRGAVWATVSRGHDRETHQFGDSRPSAPHSGRLNLRRMIMIRPLDTPGADPHFVDGTTMEIATCPESTHRSLVPFVASPSTKSGPSLKEGAPTGQHQRAFSSATNASRSARESLLTLSAEVTICQCPRPTFRGNDI
jgi:hypothetical protein